MMNKKVTILKDYPTITVLAEMTIQPQGVMDMAEWVRVHRPDCIDISRKINKLADVEQLLPHNVFDEAWGEQRPAVTPKILTNNEMLVELAGRKCYDSFSNKAGKKTNREYMEHIFSMDPIHSSILYHAKMTFFFAGVSRKFSHQFIRNYVGSDRNEEGNPSQESTRFTHHYGFYVAPPYDIDNSYISSFEVECQHNYDRYCEYIERCISRYVEQHGKPPTGGQRKDIYEAAAGRLNMSAETSFVWTTNPMAIRKFLKERCHDGADAEIDRFATKLAVICFTRWPNLFIGKDLDAVHARVEPKRLNFV